MTLLRKVVLINFSHFICLAIGLLQMVVISRGLGPAGVGQYAVILSPLVIFTQLFCFGIPISFLYYSQHDPQNYAKYLMNSIYSILLCGVSGGLLLAATIIFFPNYFGKLPFWLIIIMAIYMPMILEGVIARNDLMREIHARRLSLLNLVADLIIIVVLGVLFLFKVMTVPLALMCYVLSAAIRSAMGWYWMMPNLDFSKKLEPTVVAKLTIMGIRQSWADLMVIINGQISIIILKYLVDDFSQIGYFTRGLSIAMLVVMAGQAVLPLLFSRWASISGEQLVMHVEKVLRFVCSFGILTTVGLWLTGKYIIVILLGRNFLPSVIPMMILVPGTMLYLISRTLMQLLGSRGVPEISAGLLLIGACFNAVFTWLLIPLSGISGAAFAATGANVLLFAMLLYYVSRKYGVRISKSIIMNRADIQGLKDQLLGCK